MNKIYKTKNITPLIFDYYPDKYVVDLQMETHWSRNNCRDYWHTQTELNNSFNEYSLAVFNRFSLRSGELIMGKGIMYNYNFKAVIYKEDEKIKGAQYVTYDGISSQMQTIINKFFKYYGIKRNDVILMDLVDFTRTFVFPINFGINDLHENVQKTISSEFLKQEKELLPIPEEYEPVEDNAAVRIGIDTSINTSSSSWTVTEAVTT